MDQKHKKQLLNIIRKIKQPKEQVYLVGGAVRDQILGLPIHDLDLAVKGNPASLARKLANYLKAGYYILDDLRHTARVVHTLDTEEIITLDFAEFRGSSIMADLKSRDFTINAMAVNLDHLNLLVDPLEGKQALKDGQLQLCSANSFLDDPIRILRAVRFSLKFHLAIDPVILINMKDTFSRLSNISRERQRDEFFQILALENASEGIRMLDELGVIELFFPQVSFLKNLDMPTFSNESAWRDVLKMMTNLDTIRGWMSSPYSISPPRDSLGNSFLKVLHRYLPKLREYFSFSQIADRTRESLLEFACLVRKCGAGVAGEIAMNFTLSNRETDFIHRIVVNLPFLQVSDHSTLSLDKRAIYRFYKNAGDAGVAVCILSIANLMAKFDFSVPFEIWKKELNLMKLLFHAWWIEFQETADITPLINGDEIKAQFSIKEGPRLGELLNAITEEQASGLIKTRREAFIFLQQYLESGKEKARK